MSGSTDAATIAQRTKLEAQLHEARENLDDSFYNHAMDSQSSALDDENEAYVTSKEDYIEMLRDSLEDTERVVAETMTAVLSNADVVLGGLNGVANQYGITMSSALMAPWQNAAIQATLFRQSGLTDLSILFGQGSLAAWNFSAGVQMTFEALKTQVYTSTNIMSNDIIMSFSAALGYAQNTFSPEAQQAIQDVADKAAAKEVETEDSLTHPWEEGEDAANDWLTNIKKVIDEAKGKASEFNPDLTTNVNDSKTAWGNWWNTVYFSIKGAIDSANVMATDVGDAMDKITSKADAAAQAIRNVSGAGSSGGTGVGGGNTTYNPSQAKTPEKKTTYSATAFVRTNGTTLTAMGESTINETVAKNKATEALYTTFIEHRMSHGDSKDVAREWWTKKYSSIGHTVRKYAKGTIGTKEDDWAITDEPWLGDELVMYATPQGTLSYMRAGSTVVPADLTKEIIEIGKIGANGIMDAMKFDSGINMISNIVNKPEINLAFENLLHIDNCSNEVLPSVKKLVTEELDKFSRQLNYNLRRVGAH